MYIGLSMARWFQKLSRKHVQKQFPHELSVFLKKIFKSASHKARGVL